MMKSETKSKAAFTSAVVAYVTRRHQTRSGKTASAEIQLQRIQLFAQEQGVDLVGAFVERSSHRGPCLRELGRAIEYSRKCGAIIVTAAMAGLVTDWRFTTQVGESEIVVLDVDAPSIPKEVMRFLGGVFRPCDLVDESHGADNTRTGVGEENANTPRARSITVDQDCFLEIAKLRSMDFTFREIANQWNAAGKVQRSGQKWSHVSIYRVFDRGIKLFDFRPKPTPQLSQKATNRVRISRRKLYGEALCAPNGQLILPPSAWKAAKLIATAPKEGIRSPQGPDPIIRKGVLEVVLFALSNNEPEKVQLRFCNRLHPKISSTKIREIMVDWEGHERWFPILQGISSQVTWKPKGGWKKWRSIRRILP